MLITQECFSMAGLFSIYSLNTHKKEKKRLARRNKLLTCVCGCLFFLHKFYNIHIGLSIGATHFTTTVITFNKIRNVQKSHIFRFL